MMAYNVEVICDRESCSANECSPSTGKILYRKRDIQILLQMMGCKPWYLSDIITEFFKTIASQDAQDGLGHAGKGEPCSSNLEYEDSSAKVTLRLNAFIGILKKILISHPRHTAYSASSHYSRDLHTANRLFSRASSVTILLGGTSGCGKSTLSALLASRFGITTVLSTDTVRHVLRTKKSQDECPVLWKSSYNAGESLDSESVRGLRNHASGGKVLLGYKLQSDLVLDPIDRLIGTYEARRESIIIEGVHLSVQGCLYLMNRHSSVLPFIIYISNKDKHAERFAVRAKYMTMVPMYNQYIKYFDNIRLIQDFITRDAENNNIPLVDNTNVDLSLAVVHRTIFNALAKLEREDIINRGTVLFHLLNSFVKVSGKRIPSKDVFALIKYRVKRNRRPATGSLLPVSPLRRKRSSRHGTYDDVEEQGGSSDAASLLGS